MRHFLRLVLSLLMGCNGCNTIEITRVRSGDSYLEVAAEIKNNFTSEAQNAIKDIKIYEGLHICPYVVGVNFWSNFISFITFNGTGRKIISSQGTMHNCFVGTLVHEYMHHLDDLDRDGEIEILDQTAFERAFLRMQNEEPTREAALSILERADHPITNIFGIGPWSEVIAYTASWIVDNPDLCPLYMHHVFMHILNISRYKTFNWDG